MRRHEACPRESLGGQAHAGVPAVRIAEAITAGQGDAQAIAIDELFLADPATSSSATSPLAWTNCVLHVAEGRNSESEMPRVRCSLISLSWLSN